MPDPDYKALCAELVELSAPTDSIPQLAERLQKLSELASRARAALAQPDPISELVSQCRPLEPEMAEHLTPQARWRLYGDEPQPEPVAPTDEELLRLYGVATPCYHVEEYRRELNFARAVLARWGTPANNTGGTH